jgi:hypothetical protein
VRASPNARTWSARVSAAASKLAASARTASGSTLEVAKPSTLPARAMWPASAGRLASDYTQPGRATSGA